MITLVHGENIVASRNFLLEKKSNFKGEIISFNGKTVEIDKLKQAIESVPLFTDQRLIIIEDLYSRSAKLQLKNILSYLNQFQKTNEIILWEGKEIKKPSLGKACSDWNIQLFTHPKILFKFLEAIYPRNNLKILSFLKSLRQTYIDEFLFLMIARQIKYLILANDDALSGMPSWMSYKYKKQAKFFTKDQLINLYKKLLNIDINQKTSSSAFNLAEELDLLLATL